MKRALIIALMIALGLIVRAQTYLDPTPMFLCRARVSTVTTSTCPAETVNSAIETWGTSNGLMGAFSNVPTLPTNAYSIEIFVRMTGDMDNVTQFIGAYANDRDHTEWELYGQDDTTIGFSIDTEGNLSWPINANIPSWTSWTNGGWHHVLVQYNMTNASGTKIGFWIDGTNVLYWPYTRPTPGSNWTYRIGNCDQCTPYGSGNSPVQFDEARVCKSNMYPWANFTPLGGCALTNDDANTLAHWRFNAGSGTNMCDATGNARDLYFEHTVSSGLTPRWITPGICPP